MNLAHRVSNFEDLFSVIVIDIWLANKDRNFGNVVGRPQRGGGQIEFVFIDFEKSVTLRPHPIVSSTAVKASELWPSDELGNKLRARKPLNPPPIMSNTSVRSQPRGALRSSMNRWRQLVHRLRGKRIAFMRCRIGQIQFSSLQRKYGKELSSLI